MDRFGWLVQQASSGSPEEGLPAVRQLRALVDQWEEVQVRSARERGFRWSEIGRLLGRHRQAVHREFAKKVAPPGWEDRTARPSGEQAAE